MSSYGAALIGGALNAGISAINNIWAQHREDVARQENYYYGEQAAENADRRTRALYNDLQSPQAIMQQIKDAGLSPALMYGGEMGGTIGQGAQGTGAAGISPNVYGMNALEAAQIGLINAQTAKTKVETENVATNTDKQRAEIDKIIEETKSEQLKQTSLELNNTLDQMEVNLKGTYAEEQIKADLAKVAAQTDNMRAELRSLIARGEIDEKSANSIIEYNRNRVLEQAANIMLKQAQTALAKENVNVSKAQVQQLLADIMFKEGIIDVGKQKVHVDQERLKAQISQWTKENDLRGKEIDVQLYKATTEFINGQGANCVRAIDALIPF